MAANPGGYQYTAFCDRYREFQKRRGLVMRQLHVAGDKSRVELFENLERSALLPLPAHRFEITEWKEARVNIDYHVAFGDR